MKTSIAIPVYQGARTIGRLVDELIAGVKSYELEVILVNDGSTDASDDICRALFDKYKSAVRYIMLSRNFGEHNAVLAGLNKVLCGKLHRCERVLDLVRDLAGHLAPGH